MAQKKITDLQLASLIADDQNFAVDDGIQSYRVTAAQINDYINTKRKGALDIQNLTLACSVGSSALTIALKNAAGSDPSSASPCRISFRNSTVATGDFSNVLATAATSLVISSGSTLGHKNAIENFIYVYAIYTGSAIVLGASTVLFPESGVITTTAEGGAGAADSAGVVYSTAAQTSKPFRLIGRLRSTQTTAGTWAAVPTEISLDTIGARSAAKVLCMVAFTSAAGYAANAVLKWDTTLKDNTSSYSASTGLFTAPITKTYSFKGSILITDATVAIYAKVNGTAVLIASVVGIGLIVPFAFDYPLAAGDTIGIYTNANGTTGATSALGFQTHMQITSLD